MPVHEIMSESPAYSTPDTSLQNVAQLMVECDCGAIPVVESKDTHAPAGIITDRDITVRTVAQGENPLQLRAQDVMTPSTVQARPSDDVDTCARRMEENQVRRLLVVDEEGACVGIVSQADLALKASPDEAEEVVEDVSVPRPDASRPSSS